LLNLYYHLGKRWENLIQKNAAAAAVANNPAVGGGGVVNPLADSLATNNDNLIATNQLNEEMRKTANDLLDSMQDSRFSETEVAFVLLLCLLLT
jgi:hypothetical protein